MPPANSPNLLFCPPWPSHRHLKPRPSISIVGPGNLGTALALTLSRAGYRSEIPRGAAQGSSCQIAGAQDRARSCLTWAQPLTTDVVWITVPDDAIASVAQPSGVLPGVERQDRLSFQRRAHQRRIVASASEGRARRLGSSHDDVRARRSAGNGWHLLRGRGRPGRSADRKIDRRRISAVDRSSSRSRTRCCITSSAASLRRW